jgi:beta-ribofuranosylaminobenzene 5'-phosphate synthase
MAQSRTGELTDNRIMTITNSEIRVTTGSRLHFGLICSEPAARWRFGGIGVMLRQPAWRLSVTPIAADEDLIEATHDTCQRIRELLQRIRSRHRMTSLRIEVHHEVSLHTGLGSGTQLDLALSAASELLTHRRLQDDPFQLAQLACRAERSAIGTVGFARGGFLVDHGESNGESLRRQVDRFAFPDDWRFVLTHPEDSQGLSGEQERTFFDQRIHMPQKLIEIVEQQVLQEIIPTVRERQFGAFAASLEKYGQTVGTFYAAEQGGVFAHPAMTQLARHLRSAGVSGMAQSSWGPLIGIPAGSQKHAEEIVRLIPGGIGSSRLTTTISEPLNTGATIRSLAEDATGRSLV